MKFTIITFVYGRSLLLAPFVEKAFLSPLNYFCAFVQNQLTIYM